MKFKNILYALLAALIPFLYGYIKDNLPTFPMTAEQFGAVILWVIGLAIGGWQIANYIYYRADKLSLWYNGMLLYKRDDIIQKIEWKPILNAILAVFLPILYQSIIGWQRSFPLAKIDFINLILWAVGLAIGGWQIAVSSYKVHNRLS